MADLFDKTLHYLGQYFGTGQNTNQNKNDIFVINIGAMDGVMFDEIYGYSLMYNFKGLYVEPIPYLYEKLKNNIGSDNLFENSAISDYDGEIKMMMIDQDIIEKGEVQPCLANDGDKSIVDKYGKCINVPCVTFETLLSKHNIENFDIVKIDAEGHDYKIFKQIDLAKYKPSIIRFEWINLTKEEYESSLKILHENDYIYEILEQDLTAIPKSLHGQMNTVDVINVIDISDENFGVTTLVTGLWDIGRSELDGFWSRKFQDYLNNFEQLLNIKYNMIIFGDNDLEAFVWKKRKPENTLFINRDLEWFKQNEYYELVQQIRLDPKWYEQVQWLKNSPQAKLNTYNPIVMSKMFLLNDARLFDKFNSDYMFWIDAGISSTVHPGYFTHDCVLDKLPRYTKKFTFIVFPYEANTEIHGFTYDKMCQYVNNNTQINRVARGGFFGGHVSTFYQINSMYYNTLMETLRNKHMGTEESIFSIIAYKYSVLINCIEIESNGLLYKFFEDLKNNNISVKSMSNLTKN